jgi:sulfite exporter TauE/SafE
MNLALATAALLLGLAGTPHCAAMCGAACTGLQKAAGGGLQAALGWHAGRLAGYAAAGAVLGGGVAALGSWSREAEALRPVWVAVQAAAVVIGAWLLVAGRQPAWMLRIGRSGAPADAVQTVRFLPRTAAAAGSGLPWVALPCGLLQSAMLIAALGSGAGEGALLMALFGLGSAGGLVAAPWLWNRAERGSPTARVLLVRVAGLMLLAAAAWSLVRLVGGPGVPEIFCL